MKDFSKINLTNPRMRTTVTIDGCAINYRRVDDKIEVDLGLIEPDGSGLRFVFTDLGVRRLATCLQAALHDV